VLTDIRKGKLGSVPISLLRRILTRLFGERPQRRSSGLQHLEAFYNHTEEYGEVWRGMTVWVAGALPSKEKRDQLEQIAWESVKAAEEFTKSEEAAKNAKARQKALLVLASLMRTEEAILMDRDEAYVDDLLEQLDNRREEMKEATEQLKKRLKENDEERTGRFA